MCDFIFFNYLQKVISSKDVCASLTPHGDLENQKAFGEIKLRK